MVFGVIAVVTVVLLLFVFTRSRSCLIEVIIVAFEEPRAKKHLSKGIITLKTGSILVMLGSVILFKHQCTFDQFNFFIIVFLCILWW